MVSQSLNQSDVLAYVNAACALLSLPLDAARVESVAVQLGRTWTMAQQLEALVMDAGVEVSEVFCPAPFPRADDTQHHGCPPV